MVKKSWNYLYSLLLSIILLLLVGIFLNLNSNESNVSNNVAVVNKSEHIQEREVQKKELIVSGKRTLLMPDFFDQKSKETPLLNKFLKDRKKDKKAKVAIIIDDIGYQIEIAEQIMSLNYPITISVLPFLSHSQFAAQMAKEKGLTVLLHLPMEPHNSNTDPGKGAIFTTMNEPEIKAKILANLKDIPYVDGVNNHMGSKATEDEFIMRTVLHELKERNLFFIDSMTSPHSIGYQLSKEMGLKTAQRTVFLDNEQNIDYIRNQVTILKNTALKYGSAIAIGHPYCNTVDVLKG
ncbi:MAG: divergent polysaccharide deacetylase family protein, partial [Atribacterota bacterium]|nr:divergent polysaccharide deacetylase family protein [Atribacterota bacterium]